MENIFTELSIVVMITAVLAAIFHALRQPLIIAYIFAGILLSPYGLNIITAHDAFASFAQFGIAFLLFMVGLNLNPKIIKEVGKISSITGLGQVFFTTVISFGIAKAFDFSNIEAAYISCAMAFSSTIVIMKLLSDKKDLESVYGRISVGFLIVQDIVAMLVLMFVSSTAGGTGIMQIIINSVLKGAALIAAVFLLGRYVLPTITRKIANQQELLLLFCIAWCFALSTIFHFFGFSIEIGALLAGITLASSSYRYEISSRIKPLRDFFILIFFVFLGSQMEFSNFQQHIVPILIFSLFVLIGNPLIVMFLMGSMKYTKRTSFLSGLTVAQISEFSLILVALGVKLGHVDASILSFVTIVALMTIGGSSYFIIYGKKIYDSVSGYLNIFERKDIKKDGNQHMHQQNYEALLLGYNHVGVALAKTLEKMGKKFAVIDYNPEVIMKLKQQNIECRYGDVEDVDIFEDLKLDQVKLVVSTIRDFAINSAMIHYILTENKDCIVMVVSEKIEDAIKLYEIGASYVIMPHLLGGHHTSTIIQSCGFDVDKFMSEKVRHLEELRT